MKIPLRRQLPFIFLFLLLISCGDNSPHTFEPRSLADLGEWNSRAYSVSGKSIRREIDRLLPEIRVQMQADAFTKQLYAKRTPFVWINRMGMDSRADSLMTWLRHTPDLALPAKAFFLNELEEAFHDIRTLKAAEKGMLNAQLARFELRATQAYLRLASGSRYGFTNPHALFNKLEHEDKDTLSPYKRLYDIPTETVTDSFLNLALEEARQGHHAELLRSVQPTDSLYRLLLQTYRTTPDTAIAHRTKLAVNMERCRWRQPRPTGHHVWANMAAFELYAVHPGRDSLVQMRTCGGSIRNKTPLLTSQIRYLEFNPYWNVPLSIIKKEIAPLHAGSNDYFDRNRIRVIDKTTAKEVDPSTLTARQMSSGRYLLRQDKGEGNSLGRIIFRFPNDFAVYLHDTNSRSTFRRKNRAVSHGCIRLERPYDLAIYLMAEPEPKTIDRIRVAIDLPPLTDYGRKLAADTLRKDIRIYHFEKPIPVHIDYYTLYPDVEDRRTLRSYPDPYGYDEVLQKKLQSL